MSDKPPSGMDKLIASILKTALTDAKLAESISRYGVEKAIEMHAGWGNVLEELKRGSYYPNWKWPKDPIPWEGPPEDEAL